MIAGSLKVMLWDKEIGRLSWDARRGVSYFEYNPALLGGELDPFPLVASVKSPASRRPIIGDKEARLYRKLPPFLADSLPDAWGDQVAGVAWVPWSLYLNHPALERQKG